MAESEKITIWDKLAKSFGVSTYKARAKQELIDLGIIEEEEEPDESEISLEVGDIIYNHLSSIPKIKEKPLVLHSLGVGPEFFYALDCYPMAQELASVTLASTDINLEYIDYAEEKGVTKELCNAQKTWIGAMLKDETPNPDLLVYSIQPCDSSIAQYQLIEEYYGVPTFAIDVPYWHFEETSEFYDKDTLSYVTNQIEKLRLWLEEHVGREMEFEKLKEVIEYSNQAHEYVNEAFELMKYSPAPLPSMSFFNVYTLLLATAGTKSPIPYCKNLFETAKENVKKKTGWLDLLGLEEKIRIVWPFLPVFFDPMIPSWMEREFGAITLMDMLGYHTTQQVDTSSEESIYQGVAKNTIQIPMSHQARGPAEYYIDYAVKLVKDFRADCAILGGHLGCKHGWAITTLIKEGIIAETGVPCLVFDLDSMDSRVSTSKEIKNKLKQFLEALL